MGTSSEGDLWAQQFLHHLSEILGEQVLTGTFSSFLHKIPQTQVDRLKWSQEIMEVLEHTSTPIQIKEILMRSTCHKPKSEIQTVIDYYDLTHDLDLTHKKLQEYFEGFLKQTLQLPENLIQLIIANGWGMAGIRTGTTILATKIPAHLFDYLKTNDPREKRYYYCHCPRVRDIIKQQSRGESLSSNYCYCGGGYYRSIWENIVHHPVDIHLIKSVIQGDDVCQFLIDLGDLPEKS